jgi:hypothetical protein
MSPNTLSRSLAEGMTETEVSALKEPDRITMETCGARTVNPWRCKIYHYGASFRVVFQDSGTAGWRVSSWF